MARNTSGKSLVRADKVLTSLRASDFDTESAVGEVIDNSIQAGSENIRIFLREEQKLIGKNKIPSIVCTEVAFGDDGHGMNEDVLHDCLRLGSSTRYNDRSGIGRFGVGATLGAISQCKRIQLYSRTQSDRPWLTTYIDLDEIESQSMEFIPEPIPAELPEKYAHLVGESSGTLVIWQKCDAMELDIASGNARLANTLHRHLEEYISRTYRKFIGNGISITLNDKKLSAYDPLYVMPDPAFPEDECATLDPPIEISWEIPNKPGQKSVITVRMSLLPESLRPRKGSGGRPDRQIPRENRGISVMRANREIAYIIFPDMQPSVKDNELDRYWGCEISFDPDLDECWSVRNIKKGARPIDSLRRDIRKYITPAIETYREEIRKFWRRVEEQESEIDPHKEAEEVAANSGLLGEPEEGTIDLTPEQERWIDKFIDQITGSSEKKEHVKEKIRRQPFSIEDSSWPGQEFIAIKYFGNRIVIIFNRSHPFFEEFYSKLGEIIDNGDELGDKARVVRTAINLLLVAYANAQRAHGEEQYYENLRTQWGMDLRKLVNDWTNKT